MKIHFTYHMRDFPRIQNVYCHAKENKEEVRHYVTCYKKKQKITLSHKHYSPNCFLMRCQL